MIIMPEKTPHSWLARLRLGYEQGSLGTVLKHNQHEGPLRVQKALYPEGRAICHTVILHPPAGIAGGDRLEIEARLGAACHVTLATPAATKWYKSGGHAATQSLAFDLGEGAKLDWLPQENLFFNGCESQIETRLRLAATSSFIGWDAAMLGRLESGETWQNGAVHSHFRIERAGKLIWVETGRLAAQDIYRKSLPKLGNWPIFASMWALGPHGSDALVEALGESLAPSLPWEDQIRAGATFLPQGILLIRAVATDIESIRHFMITMWTRLRPVIHQVPAQPLRLWVS